MKLFNYNILITKATPANRTNLKEGAKRVGAATVRGSSELLFKGAKSLNNLARKWS